LLCTILISGSSGNCFMLWANIPLATGSYV
jgi:hypothetical protein